MKENFSNNILVLEKSIMNEILIVALFFARWLGLIEQLKNLCHLV